MAAESGHKSISELAEFVDKKWRLSGKSQTDFIKELFDGREQDPFSGQTLSKFVNGRVMAIPEGLIPALSAFYKLPEPQLEAMAVTPAPGRRASSLASLADGPDGEGPELRFYIGHTVWAGSFLATMLTENMSSTLPDVKIASRKKTEKSDAHHDEMVWHTYDWDRVKHEEAEWDEANARPVFRGPPKTPLSARDIPGALEPREYDNDDGKYVSFGIFPWSLAAERKLNTGRYIKLATLMDSAVACTALIPRVLLEKSRDQLLVGSNRNFIRSEDLARWLASNDAGKRQFVLGERGTVAGKLAKDIVSLAKIDAQHQSKPGRIEYDDVVTGQLRVAGWQNGLRHSIDEIGAIIGWDPHTTFAAQQSPEPFERFSLLHLCGNRDGPDHVTFDLCLFIHEDAERKPECIGWRKAVEAAARRLFYDILPNIEGKQAALADLDFAHPDTANILMRYFGLDEFQPSISAEEVGRMFASIRYCVSVDPVGMGQALNLGEPNLMRQIG